MISGATRGIVYMLVPDPVQGIETAEGAGPGKLAYSYTNCVHYIKKDINPSGFAAPYHFPV